MSEYAPSQAARQEATMATPRTPEVWAELDGADEVVELLVQRIDQLYAQLSTVLGPELPSPAEIIQAQPDSRSTLGGRIANLRSRVGRACASVEALSGRLEV